MNFTRKNIVCRGDTISFSLIYCTEISIPSILLYYIIKTHVDLEIQIKSSVSYLNYITLSPFLNIQFSKIYFTTIYLDNLFPGYGRPRSKTESCDIHPENRQRPAHDSDWFSEDPRPRSLTVTGAHENWTKAGAKAGMEYSRNISQSASSESVRLTEDESIAIKGKFRQIGYSVLAIALMKKLAKK